MTELQLEMLQTTHAAFQAFVDRAVLEPTLDGAVIDQAVNLYVASLKASLTLPRVVETLRATAAGIESGFAEMGIRCTPSVRNLVARLEIEAEQLFSPPKSESPEGKQ